MMIAYTHLVQDFLGHRAQSADGHGHHLPRVYSLVHVQQLKLPDCGPSILFVAAECHLNVRQAVSGGMELFA